ncbi:MAG: glycosyltransferase [bacterium]
MSSSEHAPLPAAGYTALYYESPFPATADAPRVMLIMYNFPPDPSVGGLRWQEMARHFAQQGWALDIVTRDFRGVAGLDRARLERLPQGCRVFSVPSREPILGRAQHIMWPMLRRLLRERRSTPGLDSLTPQQISQQRGRGHARRAYLAWVEFSRDGNWARDAARLAAIIMRAGNYTAVISSGPPHMAHEAGRLAAQRTGVPHVLDMRDPWSQNQFLPEAIASPLWINLARKFESRAVAGAALVTMNTEAACKSLRRAYPECADKIEVVRNGCDDEPLPPPRRDGCFRIRFAGSIYMDRDPRIAFRAAHTVITEFALTPEQFQIEFTGAANMYAGRPTTLLAEEEGIKDYVRVGGLLPRKQVMEYLAGATMLLSLPQGSDFAVPAKIYEYLRFHAWMLVMCSPESATAQLLVGSEADVMDPSDTDGITRVIRERYEQFASGIQPEPIGRDGRFDRATQARKLIALIGRCCGANAVASAN